MRWAPLIFAALLATPAVILHLHQKAARAAAVLGGFALVCVIAGIPWLLALIGHPLGGGPVLLIAVIVAIAAAMFVYLDIFRGGHKKALMGRQGKGHHLRPQMATAALAVAALVIASNWPAVQASVTHGFSQTMSIIGHPGA